MEYFHLRIDFYVNLLYNSVVTVNTAFKRRFIMLEILQFIFQDSWHFLGAVILIAIIGDALHAIFHK